MLLALNGCSLWPNNQAIEATGTIEMTETIIGSKVSGRIVNLPVTEGQPVKAEIYWLK